MAIAARICDYLKNNDIEFHVVPHPFTTTSGGSARAAHVQPRQLAKAVVVEFKDTDPVRYTLAVLPASHKIDVQELSKLLNEEVQLAEESELDALFPDCSPGAVPALAAAYGLETVAEVALKSNDEIFFEAGDHEELIHITAAQFDRLMAGVVFAPFSIERTHDEFRR